VTRTRWSPPCFEDATGDDWSPNILPPMVAPGGGRWGAMSDEARAIASNSLMGRERQRAAAPIISARGRTLGPAQGSAANDAERGSTSIPRPRLMLPFFRGRDGAKSPRAEAPPFLALVTNFRLQRAEARNRSLRVLRTCAAGRLADQPPGHHKFGWGHRQQLYSTAATEHSAPRPLLTRILLKKRVSMITQTNRFQPPRTSGEQLIGTRTQ